MKASNAARRGRTAMSGADKANPYELDLDRNPANYAPLTPLGFIERAATVYPGRLAVIHGARRATWAETYARCRRLASALAHRGIGVGDTVAAMLANTPEMLECHFGIPMTGAVVNTLNTRLDAEAIAFMLGHGGAKVLIADREFSKTIKEALALAKSRPLVIDYDDPEFTGPGERLGTLEYEEFLRGGDPDGSDPELSRRRHPDGNSELGQHHGGGAPILSDRALGDPVPRPLRRADGACRQHSR